MITREPIKAALTSALEPCPWAHALWEGGSAAFGRVDRLSDVDVQADVDEGHVEDAFEVAADALAELAPIEHRLRISEPTWHGHSQCFYRLEGAGPFLLVDLVVMRRADGPRYRERERHGEPIVLFDKRGIVGSEPIDQAALHQTLTTRLPELCARFEMFHHTVEKSVLRDDPLEARAFYEALTLRPLIEALRMLHCPERHLFGPRYTRHDLPDTVREQLEELAYPADLTDLGRKHAQATEWFAATTEALRAEWATTSSC